MGPQRRASRRNAPSTGEKRGQNAPVMRLFHVKYSTNTHRLGLLGQVNGPEASFSNLLQQPVVSNDTLSMVDGWGGRLARLGRRLADRNRCGLPNHVDVG